MLNGHSVEFPNLGTFRITCESTATNDLELTGIRQLLDFKIRFLPSNDLKEELAKIECELEGVYEIVGERVLERDADGKPIRTEKVYSKVRGGEDELLDEEESNIGNGTGGSTPGGGGGGDLVG